MHMRDDRMQDYGERPPKNSKKKKFNATTGRQDLRMAYQEATKLERLGGGGIEMFLAVQWNCSRLNEGSKGKGK